MRSITMSPPALVYYALCGLAAAAASAFVTPQSSHHNHPRFDRFLGVHHVEKRDAPSETSILREEDTIVVPRSKKEQKNDDGLSQDQFVASLDQSLEEMNSFLAATTSTIVPWKFLGRYDIHCEVSRPAVTKKRSQQKLPTVLLVHGFGCSSFYWRKTVGELTEAGYEVYAIDLLGQGKSAKPSDDVSYSTNIWAKQLDDFCRENLPHNEDVVLVGNSVGSIVSLIAATGDFASDEAIHTTSSSGPNNNCYIKDHIPGIGMFNCGIGMNVHSITRDPKWSPLQRYMLNTIFDFMESVVFGNVALMKWILDNIISRDMLRNTLMQLYPYDDNPGEIVDNKLVESFLAPAKDPGSPHVLSQMLTNDAGLTPMEVHSKHGAFLNKLPIHVVWGKDDTVTPINGIGEVAQFYRDSAEDDENHVTMEVLDGGHILFDENPDANRSMLRWLKDDVIAQPKQNHDMYSCR